MRFHILTLFPKIFESFLSQSLLEKALKRKLIRIDLVDIRDYSPDVHRTCDDRPYGGGPGMVMKPEPIALALDRILNNAEKKPFVVSLGPGGELFTQKTARELSLKSELVLLCGRYEGIDQRVLDLYCDLELSIGDYVLGGGEVPAMAVIEAVARLVPGFLGERDSLTEDSFSSGLLEHPQYTRPRVFRGLSVPEALLSGNHQEIELYRKNESLRRTRERRPDLLDPDKT
ncbi:MAG: tRNA (guanosine(37)-N1)-methyltransferase TrmD [Deltaproteobacteria bacterium]|nr:tRNA (guanosine(37)-N1)-methyltransferase TrmD [Deltaproteobacteria bacterium]